jgi:hypothetical protein
MGKELQGVVRIAGKRHAGKILLEANELIFRGTDYRARIAFAEMRNVKAVNGELRVGTKDHVLTFEIGTAAEKWREKILHPKSRMQKLGVRDGSKVNLQGGFPNDFMEELKAAKAEIIPAEDWAKADNNFFAAEGKASLAAIAKLAKKLQGAEALWVVYAKGKKVLTESDLIAAGRKAGLQDVKVVGFSSTHTALKFVVPLEKR